MFKYWLMEYCDTEILVHGLLDVEVLVDGLLDVEALVDRILVC